MVVRNGFFVKPLYNDYKVKVKFDDIIWVEADNNHSHIHLCGNHPLTVCAGLNMVEEALPSDRFIRISRSEIINIDSVDRYCGNILHLEGCNHQFFVTDKHREKVFSYLTELTKD